ncbi:D-amino acid dehydrogenase [Roseospira marina]|uniref:D-amino acid dehydrogenase n=1 Tax=Roseospira marina TaxID=140057 RepID=A0A5M6IDX0_9PROT|nr:D-amino acid dehydrogenase [Roseospira marina]KAA5606484.1 D-amino acid dehydrogenase [Roseospira marina]MBB4314095.1 D-amino-acid dehydrogenase [Roseospira marina]MBB5087256.1 D-amino-acid dehydrogenase [Roseospira marina]
MNVLVLGAGVIGATTACLLARDGHRVTVVDRQPGPGLETSFANGGQIAASHSEPWAGPQIPGLLLRWLARDDAPLQFRWLRADPALWSWGLRFLLNCSAGARARNVDRAVRLALYSRDRLRVIRETMAPDYDARTEGIIHIHRDPKGFERARAIADLMTAAGLERRPISIEEAVALEPALAHAAPSLSGAFFSPGDENGDAHKFTVAMAEAAARHGATFHYGVEVHGLYRALRVRRTVGGATTSLGPMPADAVVLALGSFSPQVARSIDMNLPIYPAKGYSITLDTQGATGVPSVSVTDDEVRMVYSRLGDRLRCAGTAAFEGWNTTLNPARVALTLRNARALFPEGGNYDAPDPWCGLRPATPDSVPLLGPSPRLDNLFLNTGHGTMGWAMAAGSAQVTADLIAGRTPAIDLRGFGLERFRLP